MKQTMELKEGIVFILTQWREASDIHDGYWFCYEALKEELKEYEVYANMKAIKSAMKELSKENKVELNPTYDEDGKLCGRGWFLNN